MESIVTPRSLVTVTDLISYPSNFTGGIGDRLLTNCAGTPITGSLVLGLRKYDRISEGLKSLKWLPIADKLFLK